MENEIMTISEMKNTLASVNNRLLTISTNDVRTPSAITATANILDRTDRYFENVRCWLFAQYLKVSGKKVSESLEYAAKTFGWKKSSANEKRNVAKVFLNGDNPHTIFAEFDEMTGELIDFTYTSLNDFVKAKIDADALQTLVEEGKISVRMSVTKIQDVLKKLKSVADTEGKENDEPNDVNSTDCMVKYLRVAALDDSNMLERVESKEVKTFEEISNGKAIRRRESENENGEKETLLEVIGYEVNENGEYTFTLEVYTEIL